MIGYEGTIRNKWISGKSCINGAYYREKILQRYVVNREGFKIGRAYAFSMTRSQAT
jgi:hypothetical protein